MFDEALHKLHGAVVEDFATQLLDENQYFFDV